MKQPDGDLNFIVDFDGPPLRELKPETKPEPFVEIGGNAQLRDKNLFLNPVTGAWRMTVRVKREDAAKPIEMRFDMAKQCVRQMQPQQIRQRRIGAVEIHPRRIRRQQSGLASATCHTRSG